MINDFVEIEEWQIEEIYKCAKDPEYFVEKYCWLEQKASAGVAESSAIIPFILGETEDEPFYFQREILQHLYNRKNVLTLKSRRVGCSWIAAAYTAWLVNFHKGAKVVFISRNGKEAVKILEKVKFILKNLAYHDDKNLTNATKAGWLCGEIGKDNEQLLTLSYHNDSGYITITSAVESLTTTDDSARGDDATFIVFDELAFYEHPDETWNSAIKVLARGGHWMAISTPNMVGDVFHRLCSLGDLWEQGNLDEHPGFEYIKVHWSQAGMTEDQINSASVGDSEELREREWEWKFISAGNSVFDPVHLAACYKPPDQHPDIAGKLDAYRKKVLVSDGRWMYYSGCDSAVGKAHRRSRQKDFHSWTSLTRDGIQAKHYYSKEPLSKWAGSITRFPDGRKRQELGTTTKLHKQYPGPLQIELGGPGYTVNNNHEVPMDGFSTKRGLEVRQQIKSGRKGIIQRLIIKIERHEITITDPFTYQCLLVFQQTRPGVFEAPPGYNDDPVMSLAIASDELDRHGSLEIEWASEDYQDIPHPMANSVYDNGQIIRIDIDPENARSADLVDLPRVAKQDFGFLDGILKEQEKRMEEIFRHGVH